MTRARRSLYVERPSSPIRPLPSAGEYRRTADGARHLRDATRGGGSSRARRRKLAS